MKVDLRLLLTMFPLLGRALAPQRLATRGNTNSRAAFLRSRERLLWSKGTYVRAKHGPLRSGK